MTGIAQIAPFDTEPPERPGRHRAKIDAWKVAYLVILVLALATRLVALGDRAVSHDETTHAKYSWNLYTGRGFRPDPLMHGPLLFEATAFFFALFGVSDFTARLYTALAGVALVMAPWLLRKWLGRLGAVLASVALLISPTVTFYSRYTRHDIPMMLFALLLLWTILRYLDSGQPRWLWPMGVFFALMYATKENAYIYTAIFMGLMALPFLWQVVRTRWDRPGLIPLMVILLVVALVAGGLYAVLLRQAPAVVPEDGTDVVASAAPPAWGRLVLGLGIAAVASMAAVGVAAVGESKLRSFRLFDVLVVLGTFTLPLGSALLMRLIAGVDMTLFYGALMSGSFANVPVLSTVGAFVTLGVSLAVSVGVGLWWNIRRWPIIALVYYGVFFVLFSTMFTYGWGVLTGLVGGLAYWMAQQGVQRGSQPWYYYGVIGSLYEYMPILISTVAGVWLVVGAVLRGPRARGP